MSADSADEGAGGSSTGRIIPFRSRAFVSLAALAAAAALVLAVWLMRSGPLGQPGVRPELEELVAAVASEPTRPVLGRLTGGFAHAAAPSPTRGITRGDPTRGATGREISAEVTIAAANIEKQADADASPRNRAALGTAFLVVGFIDRAVTALEAVAQADPRNASVQSDLAAAYIARANEQGRADDLASAVTAADRAIREQPALDEAWFNRALALELSGRGDEATRAWQEAVEHQRDPAWRDDARARLETLKQPGR
jgi:Flp pilus assembly protein TadD